MYCVMRFYAKTWVTSGFNVRSEPIIFTKDRGTYGNTELEKLYEDNVKGLINIVVFTKLMKEK